MQKIFSFSIFAGGLTSIWFSLYVLGLRGGGRYERACREYIYVIERGNGG